MAHARLVTHAGLSSGLAIGVSSDSVIPVTPFVAKLVESVKKYFTTIRFSSPRTTGVLSSALQTGPPGA